MNVILLATVSHPVTFRSRLPVRTEDVLIATLLTARIGTIFFIKKTELYRCLA